MKGLIKDFTCSFLNLLHFGAGDRARAFTKSNCSGSIRLVKIHVFLNGCLYLTLIDMGGGGAEFAPPSSFFELYEKVLEVESSKSVTFQEM